MILTLKEFDKETIKKEYNKRLKEKEEQIIAKCQEGNQITDLDKNMLDTLYFITPNGQVRINGEPDWEYAEDFMKLLRSYKSTKNPNRYSQSVYIYNTYVFSCFLYLNKSANIPWKINIVWDKLKLDNPTYKTWSIEELIKYTTIDYIEIILGQKKIKKTTKNKFNLPKKESKK